MKEPEKRKLTNFKSKQKEPQKHRMLSDQQIISDVQHLYDEFGYVTSIGINYENTKDSN